MHISEKILKMVLVINKGEISYTTYHAVGHIATAKQKKNSLNFENFLPTLLSCTPRQCHGKATLSNKEK